MTTQPLLEMTEHEKSWLRAHLGRSVSIVEFEGAVNILLRVEAGRRRAVFLVIRSGHPDLSGPCDNWTPADWLAEVEREVKEE